MVRAGPGTWHGWDTCGPGSDSVTELVGGLINRSRARASCLIYGRSFEGGMAIEITHETFSVFCFWYR